MSGTDFLEGIADIGQKIHAVLEEVRKHSADFSAHAAQEEADRLALTAVLDQLVAWQAAHDEWAHRRADAIDSRERTLETREQALDARIRALEARLGANHA